MEQKGITVTFKGDTVEFDRSLTGVNKGLKALKSEMQQINKQLKLDPGNVDLLRKKVTNLKDQQKLANEQVKLCQEELKKLDKSDIGSKKWEKLNKELVAAETELEYLNKQVEKWGNANLEMVAFGNKLEDASKKTNKLAGELKGLSTAGQAASAALAAITINAGKEADEINTLAKQYNLTTDQIQKFQLASDLIDVDLSTVTKSYAKLTKNMTSTSKDVQSAFQTLGVATKDANGELRNVNDVFNELIKALGQVENETQQDNLAMQIFGKSAAELGPLINGGADALDNFSKYLEENSLILSQDELNSLNDMNDALDTIKATIKAFATKIATTYAPLFQKAFEKINNVILKLKDKWDKLNPTIQKMIPIVTTIVGSLAPALAIFGKIQEKLGGLITKLGMSGGLGGVLTKLANPIGIILAVLGTLYTTNDKFRESVNKLVKTLVDSLKPIIEKIGGMIGSLFEDLSAFLMPIINDIGNFLAQYIIPAVTNLVQAILPVLSEVLDGVFSIIKRIIEKLQKLWQFLVDIGAIDAFKQAFERVGQAIETVVGWIVKAYDWFISLIEKAKEFLGLQGQIEAGGTTIYTGSSGKGYGGSGGYFSGGYSSGVVLNNTINIENNGNPISQQTVLGWADLMTDRINENLGRLM